MEQAPDGKWSVEAIAVDVNKTSSYTASLGTKVINAAYLTLEGMVIYSCAAYPPGGGITFDEIQLATGGSASSSYKPSWTPEIRHSECSQGVHVESSTAVDLQWNNNNILK